jgi:hypothetical protein
VAHHGYLSSAQDLCNLGPCDELRKADLAEWGALAIFDDNWDICRECEEWDINRHAKHHCWKGITSS